MDMSFDDAVKLLKNAVKHSHLDNQKHIDLTVVPASQNMKYQKALMIVREKVNIGEMTEEELKHVLGLV